MKTITEPKEFVNLVYPPYALPGGWDTLEVETSARKQRTSYYMNTKLHPNELPYVDFWGEVHPEGIMIIITLCEQTEYGATHTSRRFVVTTSRFTSSEMTTVKFKYLQDAMKHCVQVMIKTTNQYDKINKRKTQMWDIEEIQKHDSDFNPVQ